MEMKRNFFTKIVIRPWNGLSGEVMEPLFLEMFKSGRGARCHGLLAKAVLGHGLDWMIWESQIIDQ